MKRFEILLNEKAYLVEVTKITGESAHVTVNGTPYNIGINELSRAEAPKGMPEMMSVSAAAPEAASAAKPQAAVETAGGLTTIKAPLPGLIIEVKTSVGDKVVVGDVLLVIETMKMENNVISPCAGTVKEIHVSGGQSVNEGAPLIVIGE